jgi:hypothetical protein
VYLKQICQHRCGGGDPIHEVLLVGKFMEDNGKASISSCPSILHLSEEKDRFLQLSVAGHHKLTATLVVLLEKKLVQFFSNPAPEGAETLPFSREKGVMIFPGIF